MSCANPVLSCAVALILGAAAANAAHAASAQSENATFLAPDGWPALAVSEHEREVVGPGVTYDRWRLQSAAGPLVVHITTIALHDPHVALAVGTQNGSIVGADEALSRIVDRAHAEAAINGDYFDISESGSPLNVVVEDGRVLHQPDGAAALFIGRDGSVSMGPMRLTATLADAAGVSFTVAGVNDWGKSSSASILTPEFGAPDAGGGDEIRLAPASNDGVQYRVAAQAWAAPSLLPLAPGELGLIARGDAAATLHQFALGDVLALRLDSMPPVDAIAAALGGGPLLVQGGKPVTDPSAPAPEETNVRYPVTGAGVSADGSTMWLVVVDGRAPATSVGITRPMLASLFVALGAAQAMAFDSGGSSEMVVRHLGDVRAAVANTPSDGRERPIADALLVLNTATPGPPSRLILNATAPNVLVGSHEKIDVRAVDANLQPIAIEPSALRFSVDSTCCTIGADGLLSAIKPGTVRVTALYGDTLPETIALSIVPAVSRLSIAGNQSHMPVKSVAQLNAVAFSNDGTPVAVDSAAVAWHAGGDGRVTKDGLLKVGSAPGIVTVKVAVGVVSAAARILVGEHAVLLQAVPIAGDAPEQWRFVASPASVQGSCDGTAAPDGSPALHLSYDFSGGGSTRAAYAQTEIALRAEPTAVSLDVYGDGDGVWLRGGYRNADGIVDGVTIARHVWWKGWKRLRVAIPAQARWPIVWTRLYAVEPDKSALESGDLWFRNFAAVYPGP